MGVGIDDENSVHNIATRIPPLVSSESDYPYGDKSIYKKKKIDCIDSKTHNVVCLIVTLGVHKNICKGFFQLIFGDAFMYLLKLKILIQTT